MPASADMALWLSVCTDLGLLARTVDLRCRRGVVAGEEPSWVVGFSDYSVRLVREKGA